MSYPEKVERSRVGGYLKSRNGGSLARYPRAIVIANENRLRKKYVFHILIVANILLVNRPLK